MSPVLTVIETFKETRICELTMQMIARTKRTWQSWCLWTRARTDTHTHVYIYIYIYVYTNYDNINVHTYIYTYIIILYKIIHICTYTLMLTYYILHTNMPHTNVELSDYEHEHWPVFKERLQCFLHIIFWPCEPPKAIRLFKTPLGLVEAASVQLHHPLQHLGLVHFDFPTWKTPWKPCFKSTTIKRFKTNNLIVLKTNASGLQTKSSTLFMIEASTWARRFSMSKSDIIMPQLISAQHLGIG